MPRPAGALAEHDAFQAVVADHAAPNRIVQVQHEAFERPALFRREPAADQIAIHRRGGGHDLLLGAVPQGGSCHLPMPSRSGAIIDGQNIDAVRLRHCPDRLIDLRDEPRLDPGSRCSLLPRIGRWTGRAAC